MIYSGFECFNFRKNAFIIFLNSKILQEAYPIKSKKLYMFVKLSIFSSIFFRNFELCCHISTKSTIFQLENALKLLSS
jgi:hypothetical protein